MINKLKKLFPASSWYVIPAMIFIIIVIVVTIACPSQPDTSEFPSSVSGGSVSTEVTPADDAEVSPANVVSAETPQNLPEEENVGEKTYTVEQIEKAIQDNIYGMGSTVLSVKRLERDRDSYTVGEGEFAEVVDLTKSTRYEVTMRRSDGAVEAHEFYFNDENGEPVLLPTGC